MKHSRRASGAEIVVGLIVCAIGVWQTILELPEGLEELRPTVSHGVALLGLFMTVRGIAELVLALHHAGTLVTTPRPKTRVHAWLTSSRVEASVGVLVLVASLSHIADPAQAGGPAMWHWGLALSGLAMIFRIGYSAHEGFDQLSPSSLPAWMGQVARWCAAPLFQAVMAGGVMVLGLVELVGMESAASGTGDVHGGHAVVLFSGVRLNSAFWDFRKAFERKRTSPPTPAADVEATGAA